MRRAILMISTAAVVIMLFASGTPLTLTNDARAATTFTVDSTSDSADANLNDGACDTDGSIDGAQCTLRAAIQEANASLGADTIHFDIPGEGVHTIKLVDQLPTLKDGTGPTTIDGYTQRDSSPNTDPAASNANIMVQIEGGGYDQFGALVIQSPGNVVRGLAFYELGGPIKLYGPDAHDNTIAGNFIGTDASGTHHASTRVPYLASGIRLLGGASNNVIGGASAADRNVLSGNATHGVGLYEVGTDSNVIVGNLIGLTPSGGGRLANMGHGVDINNGASYNVVGGTAAGERNVISGNENEGVEVSHGNDTDGFPTGNRVIGNFIGTGVLGMQGPFFARNGADGVMLEDHVRENEVHDNVIGNNNLAGIKITQHTTSSRVYSNQIGVALGGATIPNGVAGVLIWKGAQGSRIGPDNVIANNPVGVQITDADTTFNTITRNSIYGNRGLGIDIEPYTVANENDPGDGDSGPNGLQNYPVITSAVTSGTQTTVKGTINSTPNDPLTLQFFASSVADPSGYGEGRTYIDEISRVTNLEGNADFSFDTPTPVAAGQVLTATATNSAGDTSEFSAAVKVVIDTPPDRDGDGVPDASDSCPDQPANTTDGCPPNTAPTITKVRPASGSDTRDSTPLVAATVRDSQTDLAKSNIKLFVDGKTKSTFSYDTSTDRLSYTSGRLSFGRHTVKVVATDGMLSTTKRWSFRVVR